MLPFFMHGDGFILSEEDLKRYNGHVQVDKYYLAEGSDQPTVETVRSNTSTDDLKQWLRPTSIKPEDVERWKATPALRILMIKTTNEFSRNPAQYTPTHRTIPGQTEVTPHADREQHVQMVREIFRHAQLPLAALGAYVKSHITFLSAPSYEVFGDEGTSGGEVTKYYTSGTSWSIAWSYFHATRHTSAVLFYREGDGAQRRGELEHEILRLKQHIAHPMLLAYIKTQISLVWTFQLLEKTNSDTFEIEKSVGLATWDWVLDREIEAYQDPNTEDPESEENVAKAQKKAVERYNVLSGKLINIRFRLKSFREQILWLRRMNKTYLESLNHRGHIDAQLDARSRECQELDTVLDRMDDFTKIYLHDADTLAERLSQQMSSMSHLVNQRDFRVSLAVADINNELAWQGRNTNNAMMAIAVASFVFLPGTFIASVFDTPIFNWPPPENSTIVTEPFWIFWMTSGITTSLLCLSWFLYIRKKYASDRVRRQEARKDFRKRILRTPTLTKRAKRTGPEVEVISDRGWLGHWYPRLGGGIDEEKGIGALKAVSFDGRR
ncbi:hypothetical protein PMZ80_007236 [Knufia obscura]|uniref:Uncharacterized protein n=1 Tax=Knufia obscura TaxID=1635080 RepID=A0ABR0RKQ9_9EURO|nr:hypothetical protein PMZ80_007236 [Knufia obscura]